MERIGILFEHTLCCFDHWHNLRDDYHIKLGITHLRYEVVLILTLNSWIHFTHQFQRSNVVQSKDLTYIFPLKWRRSAISIFFQRRNWATCSENVALLLCLFFAATSFCAPPQVVSKAAFSRCIFHKNKSNACKIFNKVPSRFAGVPIEWCELNHDSRKISLGDTLRRMKVRFVINLRFDDILLHGCILKTASWERQNL